MTRLASAHPDHSPFHPGERAVQLRAGVREEAESRGRRMLTRDLNEAQVQFFHSLPFLVSGHTDHKGQPWAGLVTGKPGFFRVDADSHRGTIDWHRAANPTGISVSDGDPVGLLGIEPATRRRNRLNGTVTAADEAFLQVTIDQGYGNCPKYITEREWPARRFAGRYDLEETKGLSDAALALASRTDTFFIATSSGPSGSKATTSATAWGADVSHRGGPPGFLRAAGDQLQFDDFPGNNMFNTLGNLARYAACGILLLDYDSGEIIQLAARAALAHEGENRRVSLRVDSTRHWRRAGTGGKQS